MITAGRTSQQVSTTNSVIGNNLFIENGAKVEYATINTDRGAVYIGKDTEIMEGSLIRGPFALCEGAQVKMGAKVYGPTTIGPGSRIMERPIKTTNPMPPTSTCYAALLALVMGCVAHSPLPRPVSAV